MQCNFDVFDITPSVQSHRHKTQVKVGKTRSYLHTDCATVSFRDFCIQNKIFKPSNRIPQHAELHSFQFKYGPKNTSMSTM